MNLPKALAVLSRNAPLEAPALPDLTAPTSSPIKPAAMVEVRETGDENTGSYRVVAVVKKKIIFSKRPVPIVGQAASVIGQENTTV